ELPSTYEPGTKTSVPTRRPSRRMTTWSTAGWPLTSELGVVDRADDLFPEGLALLDHRALLQLLPVIEVHRARLVGLALDEPVVEVDAGGSALRRWTAGRGGGRGGGNGGGRRNRIVRGLRRGARGRGRGLGRTGLGGGRALALAAALRRAGLGLRRRGRLLRGGLGGSLLRGGGRGVGRKHHRSRERGHERHDAERSSSSHGSTPSKSNAVESCQRMHRRDSPDEFP